MAVTPPESPCIHTYIHGYADSLLIKVGGIKHACVFKFSPETYFMAAAGLKLWGCGFKYDEIL
jgi:hypothetical protein